RILTPNGTLLLACEASKLNIYLPDLIEETCFNHFLSESNLVIETISSSAGFIRYEIRKSTSSYPTVF
ncbi:hypothetical protein IGI42_003307, partial [Enterococcus sp. AZ109]